MLVTIDETDDLNLKGKFNKDKGEIVEFGYICNTKCLVCLNRIVPSLINPDGIQQPVVFCNPLSSKIVAAYHTNCFNEYLLSNQTEGIKDLVTQTPLKEFKNINNLNPPYNTCEELEFTQTPQHTNVDYGDYGGSKKKRITSKKKRKTIKLKKRKTIKLKKSSKKKK